MQQVETEVGQLIHSFNEMKVSIAALIGEMVTLSNDNNDTSSELHDATAKTTSAGRGFAIAAEEIRKLAEQSQESTYIISQVTAELKSNSEESIKITETSYESLQKQMQSVANTRDKFNNVQYD